MLWEKFKPEYTRCQDVAPVSPPKTTPIIELELSDVPPLPRVWFLHSDNTKIIQVQREAFLYNWRKVRTEDEYPRYENVIKMFERHLSSFREFIKDERIGVISPTQYELTYVNIIPRNDWWSSTDGFKRLFPDFSWRKENGRFLPIYEATNWRTIFPMPDDLGKMTVSIKTGKRRTDDLPVINLELNVKGFNVHEKEDIRRWFDVAHEWIVRGFADITSEDVQRSAWGRK